MKRSVKFNLNSFYLSFQRLHWMTLPSFPKSPLTLLSEQPTFRTSLSSTIVSTMGGHNNAPHWSGDFCSRVVMMDFKTPATPSSSGRPTPPWVALWVTRRLRRRRFWRVGDARWGFTCTDHRRKLAPAESFLFRFCLYNSNR